MRIAVLGATGLVGRTMLEIMESRSWVKEPPLALASARSRGRHVPWRGGQLECREVSAGAFEGVDIALFSAGAGPSRQWAPLAAQAGAVVIDNSSAWRMDPGVPLIVPEINGHLVDQATACIVANPNCSTIQIAMAVAPLDRAFGVAEVHATTFQAVSGAGQKAVDELSRQSGGAAPSGDIFPRPIARNVIPAIGAALDDGSFEEETKVRRELRKILGRDERLAVTCTAVRVPVVHGHSAALRIVCSVPVAAGDAAAVLAAWPGLEVADGPHDYAAPRDIEGRTIVHVGRLRSDPDRDRALLCWVVADNLLKGAAWNAVQIADRLVAGRGA